MTIVAGNFPHRVTIQRTIQGVDSIGQPVEGVETVAIVWASILYTSGLETIKGGAETSIAKASIRIRYRTGINASMTVLHGTTKYQIYAVLPDTARREYVDLVCQVIDGGL